MLVDSHCHLDRLDLSLYQGDLSQALLAAEQKGVSHFLCVSVDLQDFPRLCTIAETYPNVQITAGLHPNDPVEHEPTVDELVKLASHAKVVGIGETGLDYYRSQGDVEWQRQRFRRHIQAAKIIKKPLIIHTRQAAEDTLKILQEEGADKVGAVMHCFTESWEIAQQAMELGFYISFSGIVTFQNAKEIHEIVKKVPLERMLIETDSPYLAPAPFRGKPNEPAYVRLVAERIAELKEVDFESVAKKQTTDNFFGCSPEVEKKNLLQNSQLF